MRIQVAERIKELRLPQKEKLQHSWRRIAEIICSEFPDQPILDGWELEAASGDQLYGMELCQRAADLLGYPDGFDILQ